ncbi:MAG: TerB family tellurite resistance protein [Myxococcales bacterium]
MYWSFLRRSGVERKGSLAEGKCPCCGAPVENAPTATCGSCEAVLNSGIHDWVLAEIMYGSFKASRPPPAEGLAELAAQDPALSRQVLEDKASLVFWKWIEAQVLGESKRFARFSMPKAFEKAKAWDGKHAKHLMRVTVRSVDLVIVERDGRLEHAWFRVHWVTRMKGAGRLMRSNFLHLARKCGQRTNAKRGMATERCHSCAAPQSERDAVECRFCGALLAEDWAFVELVSPEAFSSKRAGSQGVKADSAVTSAAGEADWLSALQDAAGAGVEALSAGLGTLSDPWERERALAAMVAMARADGEVSADEQRLLRKCAQRWGLKASQLSELLDTPQEDLAELTPRNPGEGRMFFAALVAASLADGKLGGAERELLEATARRLAIKPDEVRAIVDRLCARGG